MLILTLKGVAWLCFGSMTRLQNLLCSQNICSTQQCWVLLSVFVLLSVLSFKLCPGELSCSQMKSSNLTSVSLCLICNNCCFSLTLSSPNQPFNQSVFCLSITSSASSYTLFFRVARLYLLQTHYPTVCITKYLYKQTQTQYHKFILTLDGAPIAWRK